MERALSERCNLPTCRRDAQYMGMVNCRLMGPTCTRFVPLPASSSVARTCVGAQAPVLRQAPHAADWAHLPHAGWCKLEVPRTAAAQAHANTQQRTGEVCPVAARCTHMAEQRAVIADQMLTCKTTAEPRLMRALSVCSLPPCTRRNLQSSLCARSCQSWLWLPGGFRSRGSSQCTRDTCAGHARLQGEGFLAGYVAHLARMSLHRWLWHEVLTMHDTASPGTHAATAAGLHETPEGLGP